MSEEKVYKVTNLRKRDDYVYDIETEGHDFICGFRLIVHKHDSFLLSVNTKELIRDMEKLTDLIDFSDLNENHKPHSNKIKTVIGNFKKETL